MTKIPHVGSRELIRVLRSHGFKRSEFGKGSHRSYIRQNDDGTKNSVTVVEGKKEIPTGTLFAILDRAGISREQFLRDLKD